MAQAASDAIYERFTPVFMTPESNGSDRGVPAQQGGRSASPLHGRTVLGDRNRLATLQRLNLIGPAPEPAFERLVRLAQQIIDAPVCLVSIVDDRFQYFKAAIGLDGPAAEARQTPLSHSFCQHVVTSGRPLIVDDARITPLVRENLAIRDLSVIAYMGVPIVSPNGFVLGSFCVISPRPREWKEAEVGLLQQFSQLVTHELAGRESRSAADAALQASKEQLHRLLGWADCLVWEAQVECTEDDWAWRFSIQPSGLFHRLFGERLPPPNVGLWYRFELPEQAEMDRRSRESMLQGKAGYNHEFRVIREGVTTWIRETVTIRRDGPDRFWVVGVATDITPLRQAENALRATQAQMQAVLENAGVGIASVDASGVFTTWNPAMETMTGWAAGEVVGRASPSLILSEREAARLAGAHAVSVPQPADGRTLVQGALASPGSCVWEAQCVRRNGTSVPVSLHLGTIRTPDGMLAGGVLVLQDLTARKEIEAKLGHARDEALESSRLKSQFLANMSHEIRTPMNGIMGMAGLLMETSLDDRQRSMGQVILNSADSLLEIIDDILDFSKIEAGHLRIEPAPFDLRALVEDAAILLAPRAHEKGIEIACDIAADVPERIVGDATRVRQVVMNLAGNAVKFTDEGEVVLQLSLRRPVAGRTASIRILISDTGPGIAPQAAARLFQPFVQGDGSHTRRHGGTGLGLAISRQLADLMEGSLEFESSPGRGSRFWFDFDAQIDAAPPRQGLPGGSTGPVLVVEDNATSRGVLARQLGAIGIAAEQAANARAGLALLQEAAARGAPFALALVDFQMPDAGGLDLAEWIRADSRLADLPIAMLSSTSSFRDTGRASSLRIARVLVKPVRAAVLHAAVSEMLGSAPAAAVSRDPLTAPPGRAPSGTHILLAEDNPANQLVASMLLQHLGCTVDVVANGQLALDRLRQVHYDAVLMDCQMPILDGYSAARAIRAGEVPGVDPRIPVIALTAYAMAGDRKRCLDAGMDDYLAKPLRAPALEQVLLRHGLTARQSSGPAEAPRPAAPAQAVLDAGVLDECRRLPGRNGRTMLADIADLYLELEAARMDELSGYVNRGDMRAVAGAAHTMAGSCANLGANHARTLLLNLEGHARRGDPAGVRESFEIVREALASVHDAVTALQADPVRVAPPPQP